MSVIRVKCQLICTERQVLSKVRVYLESLELCSRHRDLHMDVEHRQRATRQVQGQTIQDEEFTHERRQVTRDYLVSKTYIAQ